VQCKHHESDKTIPPAEIEGEVTQVSSAPFSIDEYYILTSARKTTHAQNAVIRINKDQVSKKGFKVFLWAWEDIEERLSQLDDATQEQVIHGDSGRSGPAVCRMLTGALEVHFDRPLYASAAHIDLELEAAKGLLDRHDIKIAEHKLAEIDSRSGDRFQPHHSYQLKILRSRVYSSRWEWVNAGREILAAIQHTPKTEKARINEALGYELLGDRQKAHSIADQLRSEFPQSVRLITIWVRTAPQLVDFTTLSKVAAPFASDDEELCLALAYRSLTDGRYDDSIRHASRAIEIDANSPQAWFVFAQAKHSIGYQPYSGLLKNILIEAEEHYSQALKFAKDENLPGLESAIRVNRGKLRHILGLPGADADYAAAIELNRKDETPVLEYAKFLLDQDRYANAVGILCEMAGRPNAIRLFYEAASRHGRNQGDDRTQAESLLRQVIVSEPGERWVDAHIYLVQFAIEAKTTAAARNVIATSRLLTECPFVFHTLCGWLSESDGKPDDAKAAYCEALAELTDVTQHEHSFLLAQALAKMGDDEAALTLFERSYRCGVFNLECRNLLACAQRLERHEVACRICRELREAGATDQWIALTEIQTLQQYDRHEALRVAAEYLTVHPSDRHIALWQSVLALRLDRTDLLITDLTRFPEAGEMTPKGTCLVIHVLVETGQHAAALRYAYQALRAHFNNSFAHGQFVWQFQRLFAHIPELRIGGTSRLGSAVCYREDRSEEDRWLIIEDEPNPELDRQEFAPDHAVSQAMNGRRVGETIVISQGIQPRTANIREAFHKYIFRSRDCMNQFQVRFPGESIIQMIDVGSPDGGYDFTPVIKALEGQNRGIDVLNDGYRSKPIPLISYAKMAGRDEIITWKYLTSDKTLGIRCCNESMESLLTTVPLLARCKSVVIDLIALNTLGQLDLLNILGNKSHKFIVSQTTFERLQHLAKNAEEDRRSEGTISLVGRQLTYTPVIPEQREQYIGYLRSLVDAVRQYTEIVPCTKAASLEPKRREQLVEVLGRHNLDSMLLATELDTVLWTDDAILGVLGHMEFQSQRVWTQAVLLDRHQSGNLTRAQYCQAVAKLIGWHYHSIECNAETLIAAAEVAEWDTTRWPMPQVMRTLNISTANPVHRIGAAAEAIRTAWRRDLPLMKRQGYVFAILAGLGSVKLIRRLMNVMPTVFSLDVFAAEDVLELVRYWLRHPTGLVQP